MLRLEIMKQDFDMLKTKHKEALAHRDQLLLQLKSRASSAVAADPSRSSAAEVREAADGFLSEHVDRREKTKKSEGERTISEANPSSTPETSLTVKEVTRNRV